MTSEFTGDESGAVLVSGGSRRVSAADTAYTWLKDRIGAVPRDVGVIISEADVAQGSGTGRTPAREALQRLENEGYLQIIPRKGIYIPPISNSDIASVMQARRLVEEWCAEQAAIGAGLSDGRLQQLVEEQARLLGETKPFIEEDRLFHSTIVAAAGNPILSSFYEQLRDRQVRMGIMALQHRDGGGTEVLAEHRTIADAISSGDAVAARRAVSLHIDNTLSALLREGNR